MDQKQSRRRLKIEIRSIIADALPGLVEENNGDLESAKGVVCKTIEEIIEELKREDNVMVMD